MMDGLRRAERAGAPHRSARFIKLTSPSATPAQPPKAHHRGGGSALALPVLLSFCLSLGLSILLMALSVQTILLCLFLFFPVVSALFLSVLFSPIISGSFYLFALFVFLALLHHSSSCLSQSSLCPFPPSYPSTPWFCPHPVLQSPVSVCLGRDHAPSCCFIPELFP